MWKSYETSYDFHIPFHEILHLGYHKLNASKIVKKVDNTTTSSNNNHITQTLGSIEVISVSKERY